MKKKKPPPELCDGDFDGDWFDDPPFQSHSGTSIAAAHGVKNKAATLRRQVYEAIRDAPDGLTDDEGQDALNMIGNTYRPRRRELEKVGLVKPNGKRRPTKTGAAAGVWEVVPFKPKTIEKKLKKAGDKKK